MNFVINSPREVAILGLALTVASQSFDTQAILACELGDFRSEDVHKQNARNARSLLNRLTESAREFVK